MGTGEDRDRDKGWGRGLKQTRKNSFLIRKSLNTVTQWCESKTKAGGCHRFEASLEYTARAC